MVNRYIFHKQRAPAWNGWNAGAIVGVPELGEKGLQASTVEMVNKPGVAEMHNELHDLPTIK
jgi:hypothetical protein